MQVAHVKRADLTLMTADKTIHGYPVRTPW